MPYHPVNQVAKQYCYEGEGDSDFGKINHFYNISLFSQDTDSGYVGRGSEGSQITAKGCTKQKTEVQKSRFYDKI